MDEYDIIDEGKGVRRSSLPFRRVEVYRWGALPSETALSRERRLMDYPEGGSLTLAFWRPSRSAVVLGRGAAVEREVFTSAARADGVRVIRRFSGGGTIYLPGENEEGSVLCAVLVLPVPGGDFARFPISGVQEMGGNVIAGALSALGVESSLQGLGDLTVAGRKVSGSAQCRRKNAVLYHASILVEAPSAAMDRYLRFPPKAPAYRSGRPHRDFVTGLVSLTRESPEVLQRTLPGLIAESAHSVLGL